MKKFILSTLALSVILLISEGVRNGYLLRHHWVEQFQSLGLVYPEELINNLWWGVWIVCIAVMMTFLSKKLSVLENASIVWLAMYPLAFIALWNYKVLAISVLPIAVPWSFAVMFIMAKVAHSVYAKHA